MIIVADTSPICYLILLGKIELLQQLFGGVIIPQKVYSELISEGAPSRVQEWMERMPNWLEVRLVTGGNDSGLRNLDPGEREAIMLAENLAANLIIIDERAGRAIAEKRGLKVTGLLGVLELAANADLIELPTVIRALQKTNFRIAPNLLNSVLNRHQNQ